MPRFKVDATETITKSYTIWVEAKSPEMAAAAAVAMAETGDLTPDDYSVGFDVWDVTEEEGEDEEVAD